MCKMNIPSAYLYGTDAGANVDVYRLRYRFLETDDEYFNYGLVLPDDALEKSITATPSASSGNERCRRW